MEANEEWNMDSNDKESKKAYISVLRRGQKKYKMKDRKKMDISDKMLMLK